MVNVGAAAVTHACDGDGRPLPLPLQNKTFSSRLLASGLLEGRSRPNAGVTGGMSRGMLDQVLILYMARPFKIILKRCCQITAADATVEGAI